MRRKEKPAANHYDHIYNRGVNFQNIFFIPENWLFFLRRLRHYCTPDKATIIAYCLMPNHYHILAHLHTTTFGEDVMQPLMVSYTKAINKQESRVGPLFQGPYHAKLIDNNHYLIHLSRYIHLNPVVAGFAKTPADWPYSSYHEYVGLRNGSLPQPETILEQLEPTNPALDKNPLSKAHKAYAQYVCRQDDARTGLTASLLFD